MDDEDNIKTKDYSEEFNKIDEDEFDSEDIDNEDDYVEEDSEDYTEDNNEDSDEYDYSEYNEDDYSVNDNEDNYSEKNPPNKNGKKVLLYITLLLIALCVVCLVIMMVKNKQKDKNNKGNEVVKIERPSDKEEYTILKQSYFNMTCKKTISGDKYKKLSKGLVIECNFGYELNSNIKVSELYFDLNNSANVKLKNIKNDSGYQLLNEESAYKLIPTNPDSVLVDSIHFYYEVLNDSDETGYVEVANVVFKDSNNKYYKVINSIETFPPEYDDKLYIYKETYGEDNEGDYYYSSKVKQKDLEVFDTFQCKSETCETKTEVKSYFLIHDENLLIYDTLKKTSYTLNLSDDIKIDDYKYEIMLNQKGKIYGVAFKKNYVSAEDCETNEYVCVNTGVSGFEVGYYSMALNNFSIALDYGIIGDSAYSDYDLAMILKKDNKIGIFSYENDNMMIEFNDKYTAAEYDDDIEAIKLEVYDEKNKNYYFEYFNPKYALFTLDTNYLEKYDNSNIYYTTAYNSKGISVTMLFDSSGNSISKLPYVESNKLISVTDKIVIKNDVYEVYDLKGNQLYVSKYDPKYVLAYTNSYIVTTNDNKIILLDSKGRDLVKVKDITDGVKFISAEEKEKGVLVLIIKDSSIQEEGKNAYKYTIEYNKPFEVETINVE